MILETELGQVSLEQQGDGPDIVLLHSLLSDRNVFAPVVAELATSHRVNLVDLPGFGSTKLVASDMNAYADLIGSLLKVGGFEPTTTSLIGNGLGAFVALGTAVRHGDRFNKLVVAGCGAGFSEQSKGAFRGMIQGVTAGGMEAVLEVAVRRIFSEEYLAIHPDEAEERRSVIRRTKPEAFINACQALLATDYRADAAGVTNPSLVMAGSEDQATPPAMAIELAELLPNSRLEIMQGVAHAPQLQEPEAFLAIVSEFLDGRQAQ